MRSAFGCGGVRRATIFLYLLIPLLSTHTSIFAKSTGKPRPIEMYPNIMLTKTNIMLTKANISRQPILTSPDTYFARLMLGYRVNFPRNVVSTWPLSCHGDNRLRGELLLQTSSDVLLMARKRCYIRGGGREGVGSSSLRTFQNTR